MKIIVNSNDEKTKSIIKKVFKKEILLRKVKFYFSLSSFQTLDYLSSKDYRDINLIISDLTIPGLCGLDLLKIVKRKYPGITFFVTTGTQDKRKLFLAKKYGADELFRKPINYNLLREKVLKIRKSNPVL